MILKEYGDKFQYNGVEYIIGDAVAGTKKGKYNGVAGILMEIKDGEDKETKSNTPELYCNFFEPQLPEHNKNLYIRLPELESHLETGVRSNKNWIMVSPEMIISLEEMKKQRDKKTVFCLTEDWAYNGKSGVRTTLFTNIEDAKAALELLMCEESEYYSISYFGNKKGYVIDITETSVKAYIEGSYTESHYEVKIEELELYVSEDFNSETETVKKKEEENE